MSENNTQIIENQEPVISLSDLIKRKKYFNVTQNFQAGKSHSENSLIIISNIDGGILSLIEKLISLGVCNFNGLSFYEFEEQKFISEEELTQLIAVREIANENVENNFTQMINIFFMLPDLDKIKTNITEKIKKQIERLNKKFSITFEENNEKLIFTQKFEDNEYKIVISKESNPSNMDFFYNDICVLKDKMPENLSGFLTIRTYPSEFSKKISDKLTKSKNSFYALPNLQINPNFNQKIIFSGNIIGEFKSVPCLLLMEHLITANPNIKFLIGPQEIITKDTKPNTSSILRRLVENDKLSTGIIMQDNSFSCNIFLPSHLPQLFEILQALQNKNSDLPIEYKGNWQVQFGKLPHDLKAKINLEIPFIEKNGKAKNTENIMAKSRAKTYINLNGYKLYCELKNNGFTDKDFIELKNAIGNIFFDISYLGERLIKKYLSRNENYDNWIFGKINSIPDEHFFNINQNISAINVFEILKPKYYRVTQTKINIDNQTKNITLSTGEIINNESYSYQKFYKPELCFLFKILVKIYDEFVFLLTDPDRNKNYNTLFMIRDNQKYFRKLSSEQQKKVTLFCEFIEGKQKSSPGVNILSDNQFNQTLEENFSEDYIPLLDAYRNYPYQNYKEIFENQMAKFENSHDKLKAFLMNWEYYIETEHLDISNNYIVLYEKLISENFSETELFEINWAVNNFFCDLINVENDVKELFDIKFAAEIAQDFANELMVLKFEQNEISNTNLQVENTLLSKDVDNFSVIQHIQENKFSKYHVIVNDKKINILPNFQLNFDMQKSSIESIELNEPKLITSSMQLNELLSNYENNLSEDDLTNLFSSGQKISNDNQLTELLDKISELNEITLEIILDFTEPKICGLENLVVILNKFNEKLNNDAINKIFKKCKDDILTFENLIQILDQIKENLNENVIYSIFAICKNETITFKNLTEILDICQHFLTFNIANKIFSHYKIQNITFENLLEIFEKCRFILKTQLANKIFDNYKNEISNLENLKILFNNYYKNINEDLLSKIFSTCQNNIFNNDFIIYFCKNKFFNFNLKKLILLLQKCSSIIDYELINEIFENYKNNISNIDDLKMLLNNYHNYLNEITINKIFSLCTNNIFTVDFIINLCKNTYFNLTFKNLMLILEKRRFNPDLKLMNEIFDNYKSAISNIEDLKTFLNNYHAYLNENIINKILSLCTTNIFTDDSIINFCKDAKFTLNFQNLDIILDRLNTNSQNYISNENLINAIFPICKNNIFNNNTFPLFLSKIQINKINITKNNYQIFDDKTINIDNIIKLLNAGFLIEFPLENDIPKEIKYSEVIEPFFKKFDETIFIQKNAEQINNAIKNDEARTNFNNLCDLYHKLHKDKSNEKLKFEEKNKENEIKLSIPQQPQNIPEKENSEPKIEIIKEKIIHYEQIDESDSKNKLTKNNGENDNEIQNENQNSALKNFKIGTCLGIGFLSAALIFGILFYLFLSTIAAIATAASLITIAVITMISAKIIYGKKMKTKYENLNKNSGINISSEAENENTNNLNGFNKNSPDQITNEMDEQNI